MGRAYGGDTEIPPDPKVRFTPVVSSRLSDTFRTTIPADPPDLPSRKRKPETDLLFLLARSVRFLLCLRTVPIAQSSAHAVRLHRLLSGGTRCDDFLFLLHFQPQVLKRA